MNIWKLDHGWVYHGPPKRNRHRTSEWRDSPSTSQVGSISNPPEFHRNSWITCLAPNKIRWRFHTDVLLAKFPRFSKGYLKNVIFHELLGWYGFITMHQCALGIPELPGLDRLRLLSWLPFYRPCVSPWMLGFFSRGINILGWLWKILLMAEIPNNHLGCMKPCK